MIEPIVEQIARCIYETVSGGKWGSVRRVERGPYLQAAEEVLKLLLRRVTAQGKPPEG